MRTKHEREVDMRSGLRLTVSILVGLWGLLTALPAGATLTCDLTTAGSSCNIAGSIYRDITTQPTGSGVIDPFVRISTNDPTEAGYNTSFRPLTASIFESQVNSSPIFTHDLLLTAVPIVTIGGIEYREFLLDINQQSANPLLSLDNVKIFLSNTASATASINPATNNVGTGLGTLIYSLDTGGVNNNGVLLNYNLNSGSGSGDIFLDVPNSLFVGAFTNVYFWSQFGGETSGLTGNPCGSGACVNNDGFEEWAVQQAGPVVPEPSTLLLLGSGLLGLGGIAWRRNR